MGTTLQALTGLTGVSVVFVAAIEGCPYLLTNGSASAAVTAWAATDYTQALSGLRVSASQQQRLHPWEPFSSSGSRCTLAVMDVTGADTFGTLVFKREGMTSVRLNADILPGDTTITVTNAGALAGSGTVYVGNEAIGYATNNGTDTLGTLTRGKWSPFRSESSGFQRTHRATQNLPGVPPDATAHTVVADAPVTWRGRWVGVWAHRVVAGVLDTKAEAHLIFAGRIAAVGDTESGETIVEVDELRSIIRDTVVLREQFRAKLRPGIYLEAGVRFSAFNSRSTTSPPELAAADPLVVVASGAVAPNEIDEGRYDNGTLTGKINEWLAAERVAGNLFFTMEFAGEAHDPGGQPRSQLDFTDTTSTVQASRNWSLHVSKRSVGDFFGWNDGVLAGFTAIAYSGSAYSEGPPAQVAIGDSVRDFDIVEAQGSFAVQSAFLNPALTNLGGATGVVRIGKAYLACQTPSITNGVGTIRIGAVPMNQQIGEELETNWRHPETANGFIEIEQVLFLTAPFKTLFLSLLSSTGGWQNWIDYDLLPEQCSAAIPYDLLGPGLEGEAGGVPMAMDDMTAIVTKPTKLADILHGSMSLRMIQPVWRQGRLALRGFATPTSTATLTIGADDRASPIGSNDKMRAVTRESEELLRNIVKIRHTRGVDGSFRDAINVIDAGSAGNYGSRPVTIDAVNAVAGPSLAGEDVLALLPTFVAGMSFLTRPAMLIKVPVSRNLFEQATPGEVCLFSDGFARDPSTGARGIDDKPALVVESNYDYGESGRAPLGEVSLMLFPRLSVAKYSPCAQVDDTAAGAGYNAGAKVLTCYERKHSEVGDTLKDAENFPAGSMIRVVEIDPDTAASPLTWTDKVKSQTGNTIELVTGLAGYDTAKRYRVVSDGYATAITAQRADSYQADDADGQIADIRAPYGLTFNPIGQRTAYTPAATTDLAERPPTLSYGDGKPLDTGHAHGLARSLNALRSRITSTQTPSACDEVTFSGGGTWQLVWYQPVHLGIGLATTSYTRKLYVAPTFASATGASVSIRVTLAQRPPVSADPSNRSRDDMTRLLPYETTTFSTSSTTYATPTAVALDTSHCSLAPNPMGGIGWLCVEANANAKFRGMGTLYVGPLEAP